MADADPGYHLTTYSETLESHQTRTTRVITSGDDEMTTAMYLTTGKAYDVAQLRLACWRDADGDLLLPTTDGYHFADYFQDGVYLGPDEDGVCPLFSPDSVVLT